MTRFAGKNTLITGGAGGIGKQLAFEVARKGSRTLIWDVDADRLKTVTAAIQRAGAEAFGYVCNVSRRQAVFDQAAVITRQFGPLDILINNAGIVSGKPFRYCTPEQIADTVGTNILGTLWTVKAFLPEMIRVGSGHIVTISSAAGLVGVAGLADYAASKFAVFGFHESLRAEFRKQGLAIRTTVVCPYYINTGMFAGVKTRFPKLLPILEEKDVARRILRAIRYNRQRLLLPPFIQAVMLLRLLPPPIFDRIMNFFGVHDSMDAFRGRTDHPAGHGR